MSWCASSVEVLRADLAASLGPARFLREIEVAANLTHPHILPLHDSGAADGYLYNVMPYIEGESLRARLQREDRLPLEHIVRILRDVADALAGAHLQSRKSSATRGTNGFRRLVDDEA